MEVEMKAVQGTIVGLILGCLIGGAIVHEWMPKADTITLGEAVNADTSKSVVTQVNYNQERCSLTKRDYSMIGLSTTSVNLDYGHRCTTLDSKQDVENLKKALDKAVQLGWVK